MEKLVVIYGTRPEFLKIYPILLEAERLGVDFISINTGHQYYENKSEDIITFNSNNSQELIDIIIKSQKGKTNSLSNLNLFYNELSDIKYFERFLAFSNSILH